MMKLLEQLNERRRDPLDTARFVATENGDDHLLVLADIAQSLRIIAEELRRARTLP